MLRDQFGKQTNMRGIVVETRDIAVLFTTGFKKDITILHRYLFQGFQAVHAEAGANHLDVFYPRFRQLFQRMVRIGLQPLLRPETRLETQLPAIFRQVERLHQ